MWSFGLGRWTRGLAAGVMIGAALALSACAGGGGGKKKADLPYVARDVGTLYVAAKRALDRGEYEPAAKIFDEVERQHPYSIWARRAQVMGAYSYYLAREYEKSIASANRFLAVHPGNRSAPYLYYLIGLDYYEQISDVSRDQRISFESMNSFNELIRRYPGTDYAADARLKLDLIMDHLAGKDMSIGRFYQRRAEWVAATERFRNVIDKYQTTSHTPEALMRLVECYLSLGMIEEARKSGAVLGANYPGTKWYKHAHELMMKHGA